MHLFKHLLLIYKYTNFGFIAVEHTQCSLPVCVQLYEIDTTEVLWWEKLKTTALHFAWVEQFQDKCLVDTPIQQERTHQIGNLCDTCSHQ